MSTQERRSLGLLDAMALVAGLAVGFGLVRGYSPNQFLLRYDPVGPMSPHWGRPWTPKEWASWALHTAHNRFYYLMPLLTILTITLLVLCLCPPRPSLSRLMRQPGTVAMVAISTMTVVWVPLLATVASRKDLDPTSVHYLYSYIAISTATAVPSSWITLLIGGRWRADPGWRDRLGRFLGVLWIAPFHLLIFECLL